MAYATQEDMEKRFKEAELLDLTNPDDLDAETINVDVLQVALDDASAAIDAHLSGRFAVPIANPPDVLTNVCCNIARYNLYSGKSTEEVETRYDNAIKLLNRIAAGDVNLGSTSATAGGVTYSSPVPAFNPGAMFKGPAQ